VTKATAANPRVVVEQHVKPVAGHGKWHEDLTGQAPRCAQVDVQRQGIGLGEQESGVRPGFWIQRTQELALRGQIEDVMVVDDHERVGDTQKIRRDLPLVLFPPDALEQTRSCRWLSDAADPCGTSGS